MNFIFIFLSGVLIGAILETTYRSLSKNKLVLPHPLSVLMYGLTALFLFFLNNENTPIGAVTILSVLFTTGIEFIIFILYQRVTGKQLWNYSNRRWNYKGAICVGFSFYWLLVSMVYYLFVLPILV